MNFESCKVALRLLGAAVIILIVKVFRPLRESLEAQKFPSLQVAFRDVALSTRWVLTGLTLQDRALF